MAKQFDQDDCPFCKEGKLIPHSDGSRQFMHKNKERRQDNLHYCICNHCGTRGITEDQADENKRLIAAFEESLRDYISKRNIRRIRDKYRISQAEAGEIFGCGKSYFSKWETGESAPTGSAAVLLKSALKHTEVMQRLADDAGVVITLPPKENIALESFAEIPRTNAQISESAPVTPRLLKQGNSGTAVLEPESFDQPYAQQAARTKLKRIK